jgi:flagellar assembly protein FliH
MVSLLFLEVGKKTLSSKLVKASHIINTNDSILVGVKKDPENLVIEDISLVMETDNYQEQLQKELEQQRQQAQKELDVWRLQEEERFLAQLEEQKRLGYEEGYQLGIQDGTLHAEQQYQLQLNKAAAILEQAYEEKTSIIKEAEPFVIELSTEIAKKVLQQELKANPESLLFLIKQTLSTVYETASLSIGVAPEDFAFVQKQREQLLAVDNGQVEVKIIPDYSIEQGGCIIRTSSGSIDARIDVQLSEIKKVLLSLGQEENRE